MSLWGGRFKQEIDMYVKSFNKSLSFDYRLAEYDIFASIAWSESLYTAGILNNTEQNTIKNSLKEILKEIKINPKIMLSNDAEDIHSWVEQKLIGKIGDIGKKIHTGRSRNDQITTVLRLWCKNKIKQLINTIYKLQKTIILKAEYYKDVIMPGYTHLQRAQPITFAHWCMAYSEMFSRDESRLKNTLARLDVSPLGSGALSGTSYDIDRDKLAYSLGFSCSSRNSLDSVSDRDYVLELLSNAAIGMLHLSRLSEDIIFFNTGEAGFIELSDCITSGSSLMPQKKNPDTFELIRGKCGRVHGSLIGIMMTMKGLPLSYNKDMQEDKEGLFDALDTWLDCLNIIVISLNGIKLNNTRCYEAAKLGYANATELADYLVKKNIPFRQAHYIVGKIVLKAISQNSSIEELSLSQLQSFSVLIEKDVYSILSIESCIKKRMAKGGVSPKTVINAINEAKERLNISN